jgi:hypothetical protein
VVLSGTKRGRKQEVVVACGDVIAGLSKLHNYGLSGYDNPYSGPWILNLCGLMGE